MSNKRKSLELMSFVIGKHQFGICINDIQEINCHAILTRAPVDYPSIAGVINLRGEVLTVMALGRLLNIESKAMTTSEWKYVVLKSASDKIAVLVDELADVETHERSTLNPLPSNFRLNYKHIFDGVIQKDNGLLLVLNAESLPLLGLSIAA